MKKITIVFFTSIYSLAISAQQSFNIKDFGAKGDGTTNNTIFIQTAIDKASSVGGGKVIIPAGRFITGVIYLKNDVSLSLETNAVLLGSAKRIDYGAHDASALIVAKDQKNISIIGKGTIDGNGYELIKDIYRMLNDGTLEDKEWKTYNPWHQMRPEERNRPKLIEFINCQGVQIKSITIKDGLCWTQDYRNCSNLVIDSITVNNRCFLNSDGIDLVDCKNAQVSNCSMNVADDGVCLKSYDRNSSCENIVITNCKIRSSASALKFGTGSWGGFKNITVNHLEIFDTYRSAIALEVVDGGVMENIDIRNVKAINTGNAIFMKIGHRNKDSAISSMKHVYIGNVYVQVPQGKPDKGLEMEGPEVLYPHNVFPSSIVGLPGHPIEDVVLENIQIQYEGGANRDTAYFALKDVMKVPEKSSDYPEFSMFGELPVWGFYVRHAKDITMKNLTISYTKPDFRTPMIFDDVTNLTLNKIQIPTSNSLPVILLNAVSNKRIGEIKLPVTDKQGIEIR